MDERLKDIRDIYRDFGGFYEIGGGLLLVLLGVFIGLFVFNQTADYSTNLYTEFLSICATVFVLDTRARRREQRRQVDELKARLLREAASAVNEPASRALEELHQRDLLKGADGWLIRADLEKANLHGVKTLESANLHSANLNRAILAEAVLFDANLSAADLNHADLSGAMLSYANLKGAYLGNANLQGAKLRGADMQRANLNYAQLQGVDMRKAKLNGATFFETQFDTDTIMPDGEAWQAGLDLTQYGAVIDPLRATTTTPAVDIHDENP